MKVAFIIPSLANRGPVLVVKDLVSGLVKRNVQCMVYYFDNIHEVEMDAPTQRITFRQHVPFNDFDVVHSHGIRPDAYVFFHKPKRCLARCISTLHSYLNIDLAYQYNAFIAFLFSPIWRFFLRKHDTMVVLSNDAKQYYQKWFPEKSIEVVYSSRVVKVESTDNLAFERDLVRLKHKFSIIGVNASLTRTKGIDLLIDALPLLPEHALVIVGDGKERRRLEQQAIRNGVTNRCLFLGYQTNAYRYLRLYDIFAMTSRVEGFGLTLLEAAQYKKNIVCSNINIFRELFTDDDVTFFELDDIPSLANAIKSAGVTNKEQHLFDTCSKKYSMDNFVESYRKVYAM